MRQSEEINVLGKNISLLKSNFALKPLTAYFFSVYEIFISFICDVELLLIPIGLSKK